MLRKKKPRDKFIEGARRHGPGVATELAGLVPVLGPVVTGGKLVVGAGKAFWNYIRRLPKVLNNRDELYGAGLSMLKDGQESIIAVNTVAKEDAPNFIDKEGCEYEQEYFAQLFRVVQRNRYGIGSTLPLLRYMDLNDVQKCEEAISLLLYGRGVTIRESDIPIEFLIRDQKEVLLGFPHDDKLEHGVLIRDNGNICATLTKWIEAQIESSPNPAGFTDPRELVSRIKEIRTDERISHSSLIRAVSWLEELQIKDLFGFTKEAFDGWVNFYSNLYDEESCKHCYKHLADYIKKHSREKKRKPTLLDCGCAHGFGANILTEDGIEYWGVDVSDALIGKANDRGKGKFVTGDVVRLLLESKEVRDFPDKFDIIACQGNTFDFFLGDLQKWFVLTLFKSRLKEGGLLFFTQYTFDRDEAESPREVPGYFEPTPEKFSYRLVWKGDFLQVNVYRQQEYKGYVIQHPTSLEWLKTTCRALGFEYMKDTSEHWGDWFNPRGAERPYDAYVFKLTKPEA
jgi:cyclopropane fatty-acyl-phospholipid synthase-like methyltransferase